MKRVFFIIAVALLLYGVYTALTPNKPDSIELQDRQLDLEQKRRELDRQNERAEELEPVYRFSSGILSLAPIAILTLLGYGGLMTLRSFLADRAHKRTLLIPDDQGRYALPDPRLFAEDVANHLAAALYASQGQASINQAGRWSNAPHTYSPRFTSPNGVGRDTHAPLLEAPEQTAPATLPGPLDLAGLLPDFKPSISSILLAVGPGNERLTVHAKDLCHVAIAGATGGGKSNIMRLILPQLLACNARVVLADPHYTDLDVENGDDWRLIKQKLHLAPAIKPDEIEDLLAWLATDELQKRLELRRQQQSPGAPLFLAIDELPAIVANLKKAPEYLGTILREGRKVNLLIIGSAQDFLVRTIGGGGAVRDCYRTAYYVGGDQQTGRVLLDVQGRVDDGQLGKGLVMLRSSVTPQAQLVRVPLASNKAIAGLLQADDDSILDLSDKPEISQNMPQSEQATSPSQSDKRPLTPEEQRVISMFVAGSDVATICKEVFSVASNQGKKYQETSANVQSILRQFMGTQQ